MDAKEKKIVGQICKNLRNSTSAGWSTGDINKWAEFANSMRSVIMNSVSVLETLLDDDPTNDMTPEDLIEKNLK
jgi:hypothetical protein